MPNEDICVLLARAVNASEFSSINSNCNFSHAFYILLHSCFCYDTIISLLHTLNAVKHNTSNCYQIRQNCSRK